MPAPAAAPPPSGLSIAHLQNNTAKWWWADPGLRKLTIGIACGFAVTVNNGYDMSLMGGLMANPQFMRDIDHPDANKLGLIVAAISLGMIPSLMFAPAVADRFGRRIAIAIGYVIVIAAVLVQTFAIGGWKMFAGRFVLGFGSSIVFVGSSPYVAEIAHPRNRAETAALINCNFYVGSIISAWVTFGTLNIKSNWSWRLCTLLQLGPPVFVLSLLPFAPDSPRWLVGKDRVDDAHRMLAKYHANGEMNDELVLFELEEIKEAIAAEKAYRAGSQYSAFFKTKGNRHRLFIIVMVGFLSQWVGNGIISYYLVDILKSVGITAPSQQTGYNGGLQIFNLFAAVFGSLMVERVGRRKMWLTSACGMLASYIVITACSAAYTEKGNKGAGYAVMAFLFVYFGFYDIAFTGLSVAYPLEVLTFSLRTKGIAITMLSMSCALFFNMYVNPIALQHLAWKYYFVYIGIIIFAIVVIYFFFPETKGRLLEEVAEIFDGPQAHVSGDRHDDRQDDFLDPDRKGSADEVEDSKV
ncbi:hypothetical protein VHUM_03989 [Vanrija humicola]|uniref:Major facilitator superfamily (MFS) profile domain-containing protein n=1 Tax=Vanrija humicola TaxID=5417 RepID=A0A7D8Z2U3_VANHU|nr:hypothetical protein VHUM_03989 [Vanrija humicola]